MSNQEEVESPEETEAGAVTGVEEAIAGATEAVAVQANELDELEAESPGRESKEIGHLLDVAVDVTVEIGHSRMTLGELVRLDTGSLLRLDREVHEPASILVNGMTVAYGEIVTIGQSYGVRISRVDS